MSEFEPHYISPKSGSSVFGSSINSSGHGGPLTPTLPHLTGSAGKKRRMSKGKEGPVLKRAASTPQMNGLGPHDSGALSPSALDKRRNKLGYQRISIACGHCRRRKIRCVLAETDELGRCQNCIRLKKECVFYPVDSVGGTESRAQQKSGIGSKASSVMSNSPSDRKPGAIEGDREREFGRFPPLASNAPSDLTSISSGSGLGISTGTSMNTPEFGYDSGPNTRDGWHAGMYQQPDSANSDASTTGSWRVQDSPRVGDFATFPSSEAQATGVYGNYQYPPPRGEYGMQPPLRSMSYGNIEAATGSFQPPPSTNPLEFSRPGVPVHYTLASTDSSHPPSTSSMLDPAITPAATDSMPQYGLYSPQQWSYYQQNPQPVGMDFPRHDSVNMQWYHPGQVASGLDEQGRQQQHQHQQWQQQHHQQQQQHHLMPPPGAGYSKSHQSPG